MTLKFGKLNIYFYKFKYDPMLQIQNFRDDKMIVSVIIFFLKFKLTIINVNVKQLVIFFLSDVKII